MYMTDLAKGKFIKHSCRYFSDIYISEVGNKTKPLFITLGANSLPFIEWCPELTLFSLLNFGVFLLLDTPIPSYPKLFIHNKQSLMRELSPFATPEFGSARIEKILLILKNLYHSTVSYSGVKSFPIKYGHVLACVINLLLAMINLKIFKDNLGLVLLFVLTHTPVSSNKHFTVHMCIFPTVIDLNKESS